MSARVLAVLVLAIPASASQALAQWTVTYLHPEGATASVGNGVSGVDQVGAATIGGDSHAALWTGSAASFTDLNPAATISSSSELYDTDGTQQVGIFSRVNFPFDSGTSQGGLWTGSAASLVVLASGGAGTYTFQAVNATEGGMQTGFRNTSESAPTLAARWDSTIESQVNIHPTGYDGGSEGRGTDGTSIVGSANFYIDGTSGPERAGLWTFDPDQFIDLHPEDFATSIANDVDGDIQVGLVAMSTAFGAPTHAALWSGSAASFMDLNPPGATSSTLRGTDGGWHAGSATFPGAESNAGLWSGASNSFFNLHAFLPQDTYSRSDANDIWTDGVTIRVVGAAYNADLARSEAILWTRIVPEPGSLPAIAVFLFVASMFGRLPRRGAPRLRDRGRRDAANSLN